MDLNQLRSFITVTQTLNFTNAARQNGVPQSTISRQINDLEEQLQVRLFYRTKRNVQLTDEGRTFLPYALEILEAVKQGAHAVQQLHNGGKGRLAIATVDSASGFLSDCLRVFGEKYPQIVVDITLSSSGDALLEEGQDPFDFHLLYQDMAPQSEVFSVLPVWEDELCLVTPKTHPLAQGIADPKLLQKERFVLLSEEESPIVYMQVMHYFRACRMAPHVVNVSSDVRAVLLAVSAGLGVTILPSSQAGELLGDRLSAVSLDGLADSVAYAMVWKKAMLNPAANLFLTVVRELLVQKSGEIT